MGLKPKDKIIASLLVILAIIVFIGGRYRDNHTEFTTEKWVEYQGNSRQIVLQDLVDRTRFVGMTRAEIDELLGEAEEEQEAFYVYYVGIPQGLFGTQPDGEKEYLVIEFGEEDIVTASGVMTGDVLPKESVFRIIGDPTEGTMITPTEEE